MIPIQIQARPAGFLASAVLASALLTLVPAPIHAAGKTARVSETTAAAAAADEATGAEAAVAELPPPPSQAMQDKFRKLQKEMESGPHAAATGKTKEPAGNEPATGRSMGTAAMQILCGLVFVLILAVVTIRLLKRMQGRFLSNPGKGGRGGDIFEVLETCHLGAQQRVVALRINDEVGVIGVTQHGMSLLTMVKEPAEGLTRPRESNSAAFSDNLNKLLDRFKKPKKVSDLLDEGAA